MFASWEHLQALGVVRVFSSTDNLDNLLIQV